MSVPKQTATMLPLALLANHTENVRHELGDVSELAASIRQVGIVQPIVVTQHPSSKGRYLILAGHRRAAAAARLGMTQVPCVIRHDVGDLADHLTLMLVENGHRQNLSPVEKAEAVRALMDTGLTQAEVARKTGMNQASVNTLVLLLELDEDALEAVRRREVTATSAQAAVREQRAKDRKAKGTAVRGRPVQVEPEHFARTHPLAGRVRSSCDHSTRKKVGAVGCGQCWESAIRADAAGGAA